MKMKTTNKSGFSLMEMMVVLLIISIVAAASAPMISKKMVRSAAGSSSPWVWVGTSGDIAYNLNGNNTTVSLGAALPPNEAGHPNLYIQNDGNNAFLTTGDGSNFLKFLYNNGGISISDSNDTPGANSVAIGTGSSATSANSVAIGSGSVVDVDAIAIGNATAGDGAVAMGSSADASNISAVAIGFESKAQTTASIAIGDNAKVDNVQYRLAGQGNPHPSLAIAIGAESEATGIQSIAIGTAEKTGGGDQTKIFACGDDSIALGSGARAMSHNSVAIGRLSTAGGFLNNVLPGGYQNNSIAIGHEATTPDNASISVGTQAHAFWTNSIAIGADTVAGGTSDVNTNGDYVFVKSVNNSSYATAIGVDTIASANSAIALGRRAEANGERSIALGSYISPTADTSEVKTVASGTDSMAIGTGASASNVTSIAIGASHPNMLQIGDHTFVDGRTISDDEYSMAIGSGAQALHPQSSAIGFHAHTTAANQIVLGNSLTTVYIPGRLVVDKGAILGRCEGLTHIRAYEYGNGDNQKVMSLKVFAHTTDFTNESTLHIGGLYDGNTDYETIFSDRRLKDVGEVFTGGLEQIRKLEVFNYTFKKDKAKTPRVGIMAQDLQKIFPDAVTKGDDGFLRIRMEDMFYALVNAVKELDKKVIEISEQLKSNIDVVTKLSETVTAQQEEIKALQAKNEEYEKQNEEFEKRLAKLEKKVKNEK